MSNPTTVQQDSDSIRHLISQDLGREVHEITSIPAGLGQRRFYRIRLGESRPEKPGRTGSKARVDRVTQAIARVEDTAPSTVNPKPGAPPPWLTEPSLEPIRSFLEDNGLPVPQLFARDPQTGLEILEDLGDRTLLDAQGEDRDRLYREACNLIPALQALHAAPGEVPAFGRQYDAALIQTKCWKWLHWTLPLLLGRPATREEIHSTEGLFSELGQIVLSAPMQLSHRDFKAENLHWPRDRDSLVLIDVQGAFLAPPEYDLVCLLCDLQSDLDATEIDRFFRSTQPRLPGGANLDAARIRFDALAVLRLCKDVSHVIHAGAARADRRRWHEIPHGLARIEQAANRLVGRIPRLTDLLDVTTALTQAFNLADSSN